MAESDSILLVSTGALDVVVFGCNTVCDLGGRLQRCTARSRSKEDFGANKDKW